MATKRAWMKAHPVAVIALSVLFLFVGDVVAKRIAGTWTGNLAGLIDCAIDAWVTGVVFGSMIYLANRREQP